VEVPAKKIPYFKPSKELKDVVNNAAEREAQQQPASVMQEGQPAREPQEDPTEPVPE
jgi:integration host factor subunit beta